MTSRPRFAALPVLASSLIAMSVLASCSEDSDAGSAEATNARAAVPTGTSIEIVDSFETSQDSFTQGLEFVEDGILAESSGGYDTPGVMIYELPSDGETLEKREDSVLTPNHEFGEGLTMVGDELLQLTWQEGKLLRWSYPDLELIDTHYYDGEGWGLCYDNGTGKLWRSDGTSTLYEHDTETFAVLNEVEVTGDAGPVTNINELECVGGEVWANVWFSPYMQRINPETGEVLSEVDLSPVEDALAVDAPEFHPDNNQVLNGIAWDADSQQLYVTGKEWPMMYVLEFKD